MVRTGGISPIGTRSTGEEGRWQTPCTGRSPRTCASRSSPASLSPASSCGPRLELREHYDASRNTVRDAIKWLTDLGLVETKPGQGTFVVQKIDPFVTTLTGDPTVGDATEGAAIGRRSSKQKRKPTTSPIQVEIQEATDDIAATLQDS